MSPEGWPAPVSHNAGPGSAVVLRSCLCPQPPGGRRQLAHPSQPQHRTSFGSRAVTPGPDPKTFRSHASPLRHIGSRAGGHPPAPSAPPSAPTRRRIGGRASPFDSTRLELQVTPPPPHLRTTPHSSFRTPPPSTSTRHLRPAPLVVFSRLPFSSSTSADRGPRLACPDAPTRRVVGGRASPSALSPGER